VSGQTLSLSEMRQSDKADAKKIGELLYADGIRVQNWLEKQGFNGEIQAKFVGYDGPRLLAESKTHIIELVGEEKGNQVFDSIKDQGDRDKKEQKKKAAEKQALKKASQLKALETASTKYVADFLRNNGFDSKVIDKLADYDGPKLLEADKDDLVGVLGQKDAQKLLERAYEIGDMEVSIKDSYHLAVQATGLLLTLFVIVLAAQATPMLKK